MMLQDSVGNISSNDLIRNTLQGGVSLISSFCVVAGAAVYTGEVLSYGAAAGFAWATNAYISSQGRAIQSLIKEEVRLQKLRSFTGPKGL